MLAGCSSSDLTSVTVAGVVYIGLGFCETGTLKDMKRTLDRRVVSSVCSLLLLSLCTGAVTTSSCVTNPDRPCQCTLPDGSIFDAGSISDRHLSVSVPLGDDVDVIYLLSPCSSPKHFCGWGAGSVPNVSVCMKVVTTEPSVAKVIVGLVHNVSYSVVDDDPKNLTIIARYAALKKYEAMGSNVTYVYDVKSSSPTVECTNCPSNRGQFAPDLVVRSDKIQIIKP